MQGDWSERLGEMEQWYRDLLREGDRQAEGSLHDDYAPHKPFLEKLRGKILDVGGGAGLAARYLDESCDYWVIDPAAVWEEPEWQTFGSQFRRSNVKTTFVRGTGETLPFDDRSFDGIVAFWSFNHTADPARCLAEMGRVLKAGGPALVVLEDMEPSWSDIRKHAVTRFLRRLGLPVVEAHGWYQEMGSGLRATLRHKFSGRPWPIQTDHLAIREQDFRDWFASNFTLVSRQWKAGFLTYELRRR